jgi:hypothetical protein
MLPEKPTFPELVKQSPHLLNPNVDSSTALSLNLSHINPAHALPNYLILPPKPKSLSRLLHSGFNLKNAV